MERLNDTPSSSAAYVSWEEVVLSQERGHRLFHYVLKRGDGVRDVAVLGKEKSLRHISYRYTSKIRSIFSADVLVDLKSRKDVVDWCNSIIPGFKHHSDTVVGAQCTSGADLSKDAQLMTLGNPNREFLWLGPPSMCPKRRSHFSAFLRIGVKISVNDFVYVLAEENKRLIGHLEDMYEDPIGNKMVMVRWFHKIDELGIDLPHNFNDREIFFSLCHQDLSIECIDGLATVLCPRHFEKYLTASQGLQQEPFVCDKLFDDDKVELFDITRLKGYWDQKVIAHMYPFPVPKPPAKSTPSGAIQKMKKMKGKVDKDAFGIRPNKRRRVFKDTDAIEFSDLKEDISGSQCLTVGSQVEVLSQDSGLRGCWFRASIIATRQCKVKVKYQDIIDASDETNKLEEWVVASRVAAFDKLGMRIRGRETIRPLIPSNLVNAPWGVDFGTVVDAWWFDGWWEGIVVGKESEDKFRVYFPGENRESVFSLQDLRQSHEWWEYRWIRIRNRPDIATSVLPSLSRRQDGELDLLAEAAISNGKVVEKHEARSSSPHLEVLHSKANEEQVIPDLSKDNLLAQLKWKSSRKRSQGSGSPLRKVHYDGDSSSLQGLENAIHEEFFVHGRLKVDNENCKLMGDSPFSTSVVPPLTSLVMSR